MQDIRTKVLLILKKYASIYDDCISPNNFVDIANDIKKIFDKENKTIYQAYIKGFTKEDD